LQMITLTIGDSMTRYLVLDENMFPVTIMEERVPKVLVISEWGEVEKILKLHDKWSYVEVSDRASGFDYVGSL